MRPTMDSHPSTRIHSRRRGHRAGTTTETDKAGPTTGRPRGVTSGAQATYTAHPDSFPTLDTRAIDAPAQPHFGGNVNTARSLTLSRLGIIAATGVTALSVAACGSSNTATPSGSASPTGSTTAQAQAPSQAPGGKGRVAGLIASVSGNAAQVNQPNGTATVDFTPSTSVSEVTPAALPDVTAGSCIVVRPTKDNPQTAATVRISPAANGACPEPKEPPAGSTPAPSGTPPAKPISGTVASVAGNTITVNGATPTTVTVTDKTRYTKQVASTTQAITAGKCLTAQGNLGGGGALQATRIDLRPAHDGNCGGGPHHGHGG